MTAPVVTSHTPLRYADPLDTGDVSPELLVLSEPWRLSYGLLDLTVPAGMTFDGASIPRFFWRVVGPPMRARYRPAAVAHDAAYKGVLVVQDGAGRDLGQMPKATADLMLYDLAVWRGVSRWRAWSMLQAVRWFGKGHW